MTNSANTKLSEKLEKAIYFHNLGKFKEATRLYQELIDHEPGFPDPWNLLGVVAYQKKNYKLAKTLITTAIKLNNKAPDFYNNLGLVHTKLKNNDDARFQFEKALELDKNHINSLLNLASLYRKSGNFRDALRLGKRAKKTDPNNVSVLNNLGNTLVDCNFTNEAVLAYRKAIRIDPESGLSHWNLSLALLSIGKIAEGFAELKWRWKWGEFPGKRRKLNKPVWSGEDLRNKTIFIYPEQGLGDAIQFVRYSSELLHLAKQVILEVPKPLSRLVNIPNLATKIITEGETVPTFDFHATYVDLAVIMKTSSASIPSHVPYLKTSPYLKKKFAKLLNEYTEKKIGINWFGNEQNPADYFRKIPIEELEPLFEMQGINWFSLQKETQNSKCEISKNNELIKIRSSPLEQAAGLIQELDLVITSDTAIAHLAGALAKPVWILLHHAPDWRWLTNGATSKWYPTALLFRQSKAGDWAPVISEVRKHLNLFLGKQT